MEHSEQMTDSKRAFLSRLADLMEEYGVSITTDGITSNIDFGNRQSYRLRCINIPSDIRRDLKNDM